MTRLVIQPLTPNCGSEVTGVRVNDLTDAEISSIKAEVGNRCVVVLPEQFISPKDQVEFAKRFGDILLPGFTPTLDGAHGIMQLQNNFLQESTAYHTNTWHTDASHMQRPPSFTIISCEQPAPLGGDTMWANQYLAYDALSDTMKAMIHGRRLTFIVAEHYRKYRAPDDPIEIYHPLVRVHGDTRRKSLYINDNRLSSHIQGLTEQESTPIMNLLRQQPMPEHIYRHRWRKGDLVIWDNRCSLHYAVRDYDPKAPRTMNRVMVAGEIPIADTDQKPPLRAVAS